MFPGVIFIFEPDKPWHRFLLGIDESGAIVTVTKSLVWCAWVETLRMKAARMKVRTVLGCMVGDIYSGLVMSTDGISLIHWYNTVDVHECEELTKCFQPVQDTPSVRKQPNFGRRWLWMVGNGKVHRPLLASRNIGHKTIHHPALYIYRSYSCSFDRLEPPICPPWQLEHKLFHDSSSLLLTSPMWTIHFDWTSKAE